MVRFFAVLSILLLAACGSNAEGAVNNSTSKEEWYTMMFYRVTLDRPLSWKEESQGRYTYIIPPDSDKSVFRVGFGSATTSHCKLDDIEADGGTLKDWRDCYIAYYLRSPSSSRIDVIREEQNGDIQILEGITSEGDEFLIAIITGTDPQGTHGAVEVRFQGIPGSIEKYTENGIIPRMLASFQALPDR